MSTTSPAAGRARATPPAGYWVRWGRQAERAQTRCAVHANAKETHFTAKDRAIAPRPTYRNTKGICTSTPARERNPTGPQSHPGGRGRAAAVARCRGGRRLSSLRARSAPSLRVVRMHHAPRVRAFGRPPPAHPVASRRREARAPPRGRAPCRHNSTPQQSPSCVSVSGFAAVGVRNPTGDRANFQSEFACASSVAFSLGTQRSPRRGRVRFVWFLICTRP